jgi:hypothetical protein
MKKRLFYTLSLLVALCLAIPMAALPASANGTTVTTYFDPSWQKTTNGYVDTTLASTAKPVTDAYWSWTANVWDGPALDVLGNPFILPAADYWAKWPHNSADWSGNYTHFWFKTDVNILSSQLVSVKLVDKYNHSILSINDDLYVFVNGNMAASGGTAGVPWVNNMLPGHPAPPAGFVPAFDPYSPSGPPGTLWYINGRLPVPNSFFINGLNSVAVLTEEFAGGGGLSHPVFEVTYNLNLASLLPDEAFNPVGTTHTVKATISPAVAGVPIIFTVTGANPQGPTSVNTDASGVAEFTYTGTNPGEDTITATLGDVTLSVTKYWLANFVTGGGTIKNSRGKPAWTISGNVGFLPDGTIVGNFNIVDHLGNNHYKCHNDAFTSLAFSGTSTTSPPASCNIATFAGNFTDKDGKIVSLTIVITDNAESGGGADTIYISGTGFPTFPGGQISNGNFQVHDGFKD